MGLSVRARVIAAVISLTAVALVLTGAVIVVGGGQMTRDRAYDEMGQSITRMNLMALEPDPATGQPYSSIDSFLRSVLRATVLAESEGAFAVIDGRVRYESATVAVFRPEDVPELVGTAIAAAAGPTPTRGSVQSGGHTYLYLVIPVQFGDTPAAGALVRAVDLDLESEDLTQVYLIYVGAALVALLLVAVVISALVSRLLRPIRAVQLTAERILSVTDLDERVPVSGRDEFSDLARTVNAMLDRLQGAVNEQQNFVDDVGHELRTPLTIIRGHLELMDGADSADAAQTRALVLDEVDRMRRMVDELLIIAKSERTDFVRVTLTDVARLTDETLAKATSLGDRHWVLDDLADCEVVLDPQRVAQAWLQLAANAVQYSAVGSRIALGSRLDGAELRLWVADQGVGIADEDRERILARKELGKGGVGTGLGLAIVTAITQAHGGRVDIQSVPEVGSRFTMVIPANQISQVNQVSQVPKSTQSTQS